MSTGRAPDIRITAALGLADGDTVQMSTERGTAVVRGCLTTAIRQDTLFHAIPLALWQ
ncbi:MAG: hypothetical protein E6G66_09400 [Actinobacteria bacterium]|nr:MAG: hypothetical protein E6G66_09400 [Actinomycetota bacterium]